MGLAERRKIKELIDTIIPERERELLEITGSPIRYEIDWDSLANDAEGLDFLGNISCHRRNMALRVIYADELGRQAVRDGLKVVKLANVAMPGEMSIAFSGGVLEMRCACA